MSELRRSLISLFAGLVCLNLATVWAAGASTFSSTILRHILHGLDLGRTLGGTCSRVAAQPQPGRGQRVNADRAPNHVAYEGGNNGCSQHYLLSASTATQSASRHVWDFWISIYEPPMEGSLTMKELPQKQLVYETLHGMNQHFDQLLLDRQRLAELRLLKSVDLKGLASIIEETRAWINFELVELMERREQEDWAKFSRLRIQWERKHEDPNDVLIKARRLTERAIEKHGNETARQRRPRS